MYMSLSLMKDRDGFLFSWSSAHLRFCWHVLSRPCFCSCFGYLNTISFLLRERKIKSGRKLSVCVCVNMLTFHEQYRVWTDLISA